jgi:hypothetical protein
MDEHTLARFMAKVEVQPNGCWYWTGTITEDGYGQFWIEGANNLAHRVSYLHFVGPIPAELELDHLCHTNDRGCPGGKADPHRRCVNWADLEPVTGIVNAMRGKGIAAANAAKTHCDSGHEFTPDNIRIGSRSGRECRACARARSAAWVAAHHPGVQHGTETHCPQNHPYEGDNLYVIPSTGGRMCRECKRVSGRESARRRRAAAKAARQAAA